MTIQANGGNGGNGGNGASGGAGGKGGAGGDGANGRRGVDAKDDEPREYTFSQNSQLYLREYGEGYQQRTLGQKGGEGGRGGKGGLGGLGGRPGRPGHGGKSGSVTVVSSEMSQERLNQLKGNCRDGNNGKVGTVGAAGKTGDRGVDGNKGIDGEDGKYIPNTTRNGIKIFDKYWKREKKRIINDERLDSSMRESKNGQLSLVETPKWRKTAAFKTIMEKIKSMGFRPINDTLNIYWASSYFSWFKIYWNVDCHAWIPTNNPNHLGNKHKDDDEDDQIANNRGNEENQDNGSIDNEKEEVLIDQGQFDTTAVINPHQKIDKVSINEILQNQVEESNITDLMDQEIQQIENSVEALKKLAKKVEVARKVLSDIQENKFESTHALDNNHKDKGSSRKKKNQTGIEKTVGSEILQRSFNLACRNRTVGRVFQVLQELRDHSSSLTAHQLEKIFPELAEIIGESGASSDLDILEDEARNANVNIDAFKVLKTKILRKIKRKALEKNNLNSNVKNTEGSTKHFQLDERLVLGAQFLEQDEKLINEEFEAFAKNKKAIEENCKKNGECPVKGLELLANSLVDREDQEAFKKFQEKLLRLFEKQDPRFKKIVLSLDFLLKSDHHRKDAFVFFFDAVEGLEESSLSDKRLDHLVDVLQTFCLNWGTFSYLSSSLERFAELPMGAWLFPLKLDYSERFFKGKVFPLLKGKIDLNEEQEALYSFTNLLMGCDDFPLEQDILNLISPKESTSIADFVELLDFLSRQPLSLAALKTDNPNIWKIIKAHAQGWQERAEQELFPQKMPDNRSAKTLIDLLVHNTCDDKAIKEQLLKDTEAVKNALKQKAPLPKLEDCRQFAEKLDFVELAVALCRGVEEAYKVTPHDTQIIALLEFLYAWKETQSSPKKGLFGQMGTGEGKSYLIAMVTTALAMRGMNVHVITPTPALGIRDAEDASKLSNLFGLRCGNVCDEEALKTGSEVLKKRYQTCHILFGQTSDFMRDRLLTESREMGIINDRPFRKNAVFLDEVDSITLDKGDFTLFLSDNVHDFSMMESLIKSLWSRVCVQIKELQQEEETDSDVIIHSVHAEFQKRLEQNEFKLSPKLQSFAKRELGTWIKSALSAFSFYG